MQPDHADHYKTWWKTWDLPRGWAASVANPEKDPTTLEKLGRSKMKSWKAYVYCRKFLGMPRHRAFEHWVWDASERTCDLSRRRARAQVGRVPKGHEVHHADGVCTNNDPANLQVMSKAQHRRAHGKKI